MIRWDHLLAISLLGVLALVFALQQQTQAALFLAGTLAGYAFKNGYQNRSSAPIVEATLSSPTVKATTVSD